MSFERNRLITIPPDASPFNNTRSTQYYHDNIRFSIVLSQYHRSSTIYLRHQVIPNRLITPPDDHQLITTVPDPRRLITPPDQHGLNMTPSDRQPSEHSTR
jgi:hypothetical protein